MEFEETMKEKIVKNLGKIITGHEIWTNLITTLFKKIKTLAKLIEFDEMKTNIQIS